MEIYATLDRYIKEIPADELQSRFTGCQQSYLMRTIIMNERNFMPSYTGERSLRRLWYSVVKPTLDKLGLISEKDMTEESLTKWDAELSRYMADLVRRGLVTYHDLRIKDTSRQKSNPSDSYAVVDLSIYGYQVGVSEYANIILATEKDTAYGILQNIASLFGCSCISGKGQNSLGAMESLLRGMRAHQYSDIYILTMTDYDPSGYYIADTFRQQVEDLKPVLGIGARVSIERIGITPEQLSKEEIEQNMYSPKPANLDKWLKLTGGIDGKPKGLELDALPDERLREIFVTSLKKHIDGSVYEKIVKDSYVRQAILHAIKQRVDDMVSEIAAAVEDKIEVDVFDIADLALDGYRSLPISELCNGDIDDEISRLALGYFK